MKQYLKHIARFIADKQNARDRSIEILINTFKQILIKYSLYYCEEYENKINLLQYK